MGIIPDFQYMIVIAVSVNHVCIETVVGTGHDYSEVCSVGKPLNIRITGVKRIVVR